MADGLVTFFPVGVDALIDPPAVVRGKSLAGGRCRGDGDADSKMQDF